MTHLEQNIKALCEKFGLSFYDFLQDFNADHVNELSLFDLELLAEEYDLDLYSLMFKPSIHSPELSARLDSLKMLVLDVDGVLTDGGMYFGESGEQAKKFNTKDGMAILHLTQSNFQVAIISSGFKGEAVKSRADMLGIQNCYVGRENKLEILKDMCSKLNIDLNEVGIVGDDINDLEIMRNVGVSFCPRDAVSMVKQEVDIVLELKGGEGCVRELIDNYILKTPLTR